MRHKKVNDSESKLHVSDETLQYIWKDTKGNKNSLKNIKSIVREKPEFRQELGPLSICK